MNHHSTLVSYLHRLIAYGTGHYGRPGSAHPVTALQPLLTTSTADRDLRTPVTGARIISGLVPCNAIPDEILTDHPRRLRAAFVESANPLHSLADGPRMREAFDALELVVVVDVAMTETARAADYVLPVATQFEKAEATFFNFEYPRNVFHLRRALLAPPAGLFSEAELHARLVEALGAMPKPAVDALREAWDRGRAAFRATFFGLLATDPNFVALAPVVLFRAIGDRLPQGTGVGAVLWALAQIATRQSGASIRRAGIGAPACDEGELGDALFDAILAAEHGLVFAVDDWAEAMGRIATASGRIQLAVPELFEALDALASEDRRAADPAFPLVLSAGERRAFTANTILRDPAWRKKDRDGALRVSPQDAARLGLVDGGRARLTTRRGAAIVSVEVSDRMQPGHVSLPNGTGVGHGPTGGQGGIAPNELTCGADRDPIAGTPWHKRVPARVEAL
jgi:anaerobic selenocysteine-containing dehydrogenase